MFISSESRNWAVLNFVLRCFCSFFSFEEIPLIREIGWSNKRFLPHSIRRGLLCRALDAQNSGPEKGSDTPFTSR
jgi:hypothetical protein